ncbi:MAG: recombination regulator RecX [Burkholderiaceae bacterium]|nr:recombination regulator RecX [Burkholderiaceae bacterium]
MLARREHSRADIATRLVPLSESPEQVDAILDKLAEQGFLSETRFAAGLARRRSERYGTARVAQELHQHGVDPSIAEPLLGKLRDSERERALRLWSRRFGVPPDTLSEKGRQYRFLVRRGFSAETVQWVFRHGASTTACAQGPDCDELRAHANDPQADPAD